MKESSVRERIKAFYYPDFHLDYVSLLRAILLFDELHFMDRPSLAFNSGAGQFLTIGADSPLRSLEKSFRDEGVPLYVHGAPQGPVGGDWYKKIAADVNDLEFLRRFQNGLKASATFRRLQIAPGDYGPAGNEDGVARGLIEVDLATAMKNYESPMALFETSTARPYDFSHSEGRAKTLLTDAVVCSAKLNFALDVASKPGFVPFADARPYGDLLGAKYARAIKSIGPMTLPITDLSFAILDEVLPDQKLRQLRLIDVIRYRKNSEDAREAFLEHLSTIQQKQGQIPRDGDYESALKKLIETEIRPAVRVFRNKLETVYESLFGSLAKGVVGVVGGSVLSVFGDLSWEKVLLLAGGGAVYLAKSSIDALLAERAVRRECSISYILSLDK
jgi:hypothetical protein